MNDPDQATIQARFLHLVTFKIRPEDEALFNDIYDSEHVPNLLRVPGVLGCRRIRDLEADENGYLTYTTIYSIAEPDVPSRPTWRQASDLGRWKDEMRPKIISRERRYARIVFDR